VPYIDHDKRRPIDDAATKMAAEILAMPERERDGAFNYAVTRLVVKVFGRVGYSNFVRVAGGLDEVKAEYRRRIVAPYEDMKNDQNGDVYGTEM